MDFSSGNIDIALLGKDLVILGLAKIRSELLDNFRRRVDLPAVENEQTLECALFDRPERRAHVVTVNEKDSKRAAIEPRPFERIAQAIPNTKFIERNIDRRSDLRIIALELNALARHVIGHHVNREPAHP